MKIHVTAKAMNSLDGAVTPAAPGTAAEGAPETAPEAAPEAAPEHAVGASTVMLQRALIIPIHHHKVLAQDVGTT